MLVSEMLEVILQFVFSRSLFGKQAVATLLIAITLSLLVSLLTFRDNLQASRTLIAQEFEVLMDLVAKPAAQAAFQLDTLFAQQQMDGLLQHQKVLQAELLDENNLRFAFAQRRTLSDSSYKQLAGWLLPNIDVYERPLYFEDEQRVIARLRVTADTELLVKQLVHSNSYLLLSSLLKDLLLASLISLVFYYLVTRPLHDFTRRLSLHSHQSHSALPTMVAEHHRHDELGELSRVFGKVWQELSTANEALEHNAAYTKAIISHAGDAIFLTDNLGQIRLVNRAGEQLVGRKEALLVGSYLGEFHSGSDWEYFQNTLSNLAFDHPLTLETYYFNDAGKKIPVEIRLIKYQLQKQLEVLLLVRDVSARKEAEDRINRLAFYDSLTQLPNRRLLMDRLEQAIELNRLHKSTGALLFLDLDRFKNINDSLGHNIGDGLLRSISQDLLAQQPEGATTARLGGDEFVILWPHVEGSPESISEKVATFAQNILERCATVKKVGLHELHISVSIGITIFSFLTTTEDDVTLLLKQADTALYKAKDAGRNTYRFYRPEMQTMSDDRLAMDRALHRAIEHNEFELFYQPQNNAAGDCIGAEALIRWQDPELGFISPATFIPIAEEIGLINDIGDWVMEVAICQLAEWRAQDYWPKHWKLSINVSPIQFQHPNFVESMERLLVKYSVSPSYLDLEITENMLLDDLDSSRQKMMKIRELGVSLSIDDFGTGYSSLKYLKMLPINRLKIDQTFVRDLLDDTSDAAIIKAIIAMSEALGIEVLAEGVETHEHFLQLQSMGCYHFQGYYFGRPMPAVTFMSSTPV